MIIISVVETLICPLITLSPNTERSLVNWLETDFRIITDENPWISQVCAQDHKTSSTENALEPLYMQPC